MQSQGTEHEEEGGSFSFERAYSGVRRRLHVVGIVTALITVGTVFAALMMDNRYDASAIVQIDPRKKTISNLDSVLSELKADAATVESEVEIIRSRAIVLRVIDILGLRNDPEFTKPEPFYMTPLRWLGLAGAAEADSSAAPAHAPDGISGLLRADEPGAGNPRRDEVAVAFSERLKVTRIRTTLLIEIRFSAIDALKAAKIANTIAEVYIKDQLETKQDAAGFATELLEKKLIELKVKVSAAERRVELFKAQNNIFDSEGQILSEKQLARHMEQTVVARNATAEARSKYEHARKLSENGVGSSAIADVLQSATIGLLKEQLAKAEQHAAELGSKYGPRHPEMQKVRAEVADAQRQLEEEITRVVSNLKNEYEVAEGRERQLVANLAVLKEQQAVSKEESVKLKQLERDSSTEKQLYEALLTRYKQTAETQELQLPDARIVQKADVPLFPASPKRKQLLLIALVAGALAGILLALALEFMTAGVARPEDVERGLDLAHLSSIPDIESALPDDESAARTARYVITAPRSDYAEAVRALRRELDVHRMGRPSNIILVASALPMEGADLVASNLAHHYALTGNRVLLVDGDMRRPGLTRLLAPANGAGLQDLLARGLRPEDAILRDGATGLCFLPSVSPGPGISAGPEILASRRMEALSGMLRHHFDTIIISAPPLLPVVDGRVLADYADAIAFVMSWRKTPKKLARRAVAALGPNAAKVAGVVVNRVDPAVLEDQQGFASQSPSAPTAVPNRRRAA